jgi:uncharacterized membrane protein
VSVEPPNPPHDGEAGMAGVLRRNIAAMRERRRLEEETAGFQQKLAEAITAFTGSMAFVYLHLLLFGGWIAVNLGWIPGVPAFDRSFVILAMAASVEAIFLSTFVLISQNRISAANEKRAALDLQINLLAEHEVTRLVSLTAAIARRLGLETADDPELAELEQDVVPETVLGELDKDEG